MNSDHPPLASYFQPDIPVSDLTGNLPHWRQPGTTYFVTFRQADALPQEKLAQWHEELQEWLRQHPEPHDESTRREFHSRFPARLQKWLDAGYGSCVLDIPEALSLVESSLRHFDGQRYTINEYVVASNHVHALVTPLAEYELSDILHSWKSFTAHEILKMEEALRRLQTRTLDAEGETSGSAKVSWRRQRKFSVVRNSATRAIHVWQKESFDHIVRSPASLEKFRLYIRAHRTGTDKYP